MGAAVVVEGVGKGLMEFRTAGALVKRDGGRMAGNGSSVLLGPAEDHLGFSVELERFLDGRGPHPSCLPHRSPTPFLQLTSTSGVLTRPENLTQQMPDPPE